MADVDLPSKDRTIGGHEYRVTMLPLGRWLELEGLVTRVFGEPLERLMLAIPESGDLGDFRSEDLAPVLRSLLAGLGPKDLDDLCQHMGSCLRVRTEEGGWELLDRTKQQFWWPRNMRELVGVLAFFLEVQFRDFFAGAVELIGLAGAGPAAG